MAACAAAGDALFQYAVARIAIARPVFFHTAFAAIFYIGGTACAAKATFPYIVPGHTVGLLLFSSCCKISAYLCTVLPSVSA